MAEINNGITATFDTEEARKFAKETMDSIKRLTEMLEDIVDRKPSITLDGKKFSKTIERINNEDKNINTINNKQSIDILDNLKEFLRNRYKYCMSRENSDSTWKAEAHGYLMTLQQINELENINNKINKKV